MPTREESLWAVDHTIWETACQLGIDIYTTQLKRKNESESCSKKLWAIVGDAKDKMDELMKRREGIRAADESIFSA